MMLKNLIGRKINRHFKFFFSRRRRRAAFRCIKKKRRENPYRIFKLLPPLQIIVLFGFVLSETFLSLIKFIENMYQYLEHIKLALLNSP
jgi:hypothetical protein